MNHHFPTLLLLLFVALTACGGEPDVVTLDRTYLNDEQLEEQLASLRAAINGEVLDEYIWTDGEEKVFTMLSQEREAGTGFAGIFLRHFRVGKSVVPDLLWTYQDSVSCTGGAAGAVVSQSPKLQLHRLVADGQPQFVLRYRITCGAGEEAFAALALINVATGTPDLLLEGETPALHLLPEEERKALLAVLEK